MKKFIFKIIIKIFKKEIRKQIEEWYLDEQFPSYRVTIKDTKVMEKISDLWKSPEFKVWLKMQANKKNHLARKSLNINYKDESEGIIQNSYLQGQAYNISLERAFLKHIHNKFQKENKKEYKKGRKKKGKQHGKK